MRKLFLILPSILTTSCSVTNYYQVYKADSENGIIQKNNIVFEDQNCKVSYNLWSEGGNVGFDIYNKSESDIIIDLRKTFFVLNGVSFDYFLNRSFTKTTNYGAATTTYPVYYWQVNSYTSSSYAGRSSTYFEKPEITIPPHTSKSINEYYLTNARFISCDLSKYPTSDKIKVVKFDKSNSPFVFNNLITYNLLGEIKRIEHKFFVSEISNLPESEIFTKNYLSKCGRTLDVPEKVFKNNPPEKFYIHYTK